MDIFNSILNLQGGIMKRIEEENMIWFEDPSWYAVLDDKKIKLGLMCEAFDLRDIEEGHDLELYPVILECSIMVQPKDISKKYKKEAKESMAYADIFGLYRYGGGVSVDMESITSKAASDVDSEVIRQKHATFHQEIKVRHFQDIEDAIQYAKDVYAYNATAVFDTIGFVFDQAVNRMGTTGWDIIEKQAFGKEWM